MGKTLEKENCGSKRSTAVKPILVGLGYASLTIVGCLVAYAVSWGVWFRLPRGADEVVDLRRSEDEEDAPSDAPGYVIFCAALANNPHGFPGHAYVVWSADRVGDLKLADSMGFAPHCAEVILPSLFKPVRGVLDGKASRDNYRNLDKLIVIVDRPAFERSRKLCDTWNQGHFQTGVRDCCAFTRLIAKDIGLKTPDQSYIFPQNYISQLKLLNRQRKIAPASI
jgi:hypothetical protein